MTVYVPGTQEKDLQKIIMSLQAIAAAQTLDEASITALQAILPASGQVVFPATQNPSSDPNTLDDYEEGTWTPSLTFATPGNLAVTYSIQSGYYTKIGRLVSVSFALLTSAFTFTTASGQLFVNALPFTPVTADANYRAYAPIIYSGITKAGYASVSSAIVGNSTQIQFLASGSGVAISAISASDMPTGGTVVIGGNTTFVV